jgi:hypothetical protein
MGGVTSEPPSNGACSQYACPVMAVNFKITWVTEFTYTLLPFSGINAMKIRR